MQQQTEPPSASVFHTEELRGFSRSLTELHWLLVILVLLYFFIPTREITNSDALIATLVGYAVFIIVSRYLVPQPRETRWKLALESWAMITFISVTLWHTGLTESPLLNLYLMVIIACAITLGKTMTFLMVALIACSYLYMGYAAHGEALFARETFTILMARFSPFLLVAYVTSILADDIIRASRKIVRLSQTDDLTGLLNLRAFNLVLEKEIARAQRYQEPFTIVMIDIDGLKDINHRYGHAAGSQLVAAVAGAVSGCVRRSDILARYGGDEFVILMTHTSLGQAVVPAERIRNAIRGTTLAINDTHLGVSASIGIASFPDNTRDAGAVLDKADSALRQSKQAGRDRLTWCSDRAVSAAACA